MDGRRLPGLLLALAALLGAGHGDDPSDFSLEDALYDLSTKRPTPNGPRKPAGGRDFDVADYFDTPPETTTKPAKPTPKPFPRPGKPDNSFWDVIRTTTTKQPKVTKAPPKHNPAKDPMELDLADAIDNTNDGKHAGMPTIKPGGGAALEKEPFAGSALGLFSHHTPWCAPRLPLGPEPKGSTAPLIQLLIPRPCFSAPILHELNSPTTTVPKITFHLYQAVPVLSSSAGAALSLQQGGESAPCPQPGPGWCCQGPAGGRARAPRSPAARPLRTLPLPPFSSAS
ncbi:CD99 antigen-like protein 2 isoform X1 [Phalacrocorax aristotelis]|uniref:CD99 antigen-like protein 2 isoform X1 n=1 Tax=Phalacrocorax aristotelis TaxID=126867 RepID=UPI003F4BB5BC